MRSMYKVEWSRTYTTHGAQWVEASTAEGALERVSDNIGDYDGRFTHDPDADTVVIIDEAY